MFKCRNKCALLTLLILSFFLFSCKKGGDSPVNNPVPQPSLDFWSYYSANQGVSVNCFTASGKGNWYIGTDAGITVSTDRGKNFSGYNFPGIASSSVGCIRTGNNGEIYILLNNGMLLRSIDDLKTYDNIGAHLNNSIVTYIKYRSIDIAPNGDLWAGVWVSKSSGSGTIDIEVESLVHSNDKGLTWTIPAPLVAANSPVTKVCGDSKGRLYCIYSNSGVAKSTDGGATWYPVFGSGGIYVVNQIAVNPNDQLLVASDKGLSMSKDNGSSFQAIALPSDLQSQYLEDVLTNPNGIIFITSKTTLVDHTADKTSNCYYTKDNGATWQNIGNVKQARVIWLQAVDGNGYLLGRYATSSGTGICVSNNAVQ